MIRTITCLAVLLSAAAAPSARAENLLRNPGFEESSAEDLVGWSAAGHQPPPAEAEGFIPIDEFEGEAHTWGGTAWAKARNPFAEFSTENPAQGRQSLRLTFPDGKNCYLRRDWNYDRPWDALTFFLRKVSGAGGITLYYACTNGVWFHAKWCSPSAEWQKVAVLTREVRYGWGAKEEADKAFNPDLMSFLAIGAEEPITFEIDALRIDTHDTLGLRAAYTDRRANLWFVVSHDSGVVGNGTTVPDYERNGTTVPDYERNGTTVPDYERRLTVELYNAFAAPQNATLEFDLQDYQGKVRDRGERALSLPGRTFGTEELTLPALTNGFHAAHLRLVPFVVRHAAKRSAVPETALHYIPCLTTNGRASRSWACPASASAATARTWPIAWERGRWRFFSTGRKGRPKRDTGKSRATTTRWTCTKNTASRPSA
jgi:hypothetical protein